MKRKKLFAHATKPPIVIPIVVVPIDVHGALDTEAVERDVALYEILSISPPLESLRVVLIPA